MSYRRTSVRPEGSGSTPTRWASTGRKVERIRKEKYGGDGDDDGDYEDNAAAKELIR
jgi:hypothetical protein